MFIERQKKQPFEKFYSKQGEQTNPSVIESYTTGEIIHGYSLISYLRNYVLALYSY